MEIYTLLREFADSWMLLALTLFFVGVVVWVFRPGARAKQEEAANMIFHNDRKPAREPEGSASDASDANQTRSTFKEAWK
jgi:cytochrome c oxidase cbb3-type subunit IV